MSSIDSNCCLTADDNPLTIDLSPYLSNNALNRWPESGQQMLKGLSFGQFFDQLIAFVSNTSDDLLSDKYNVWYDVLLDIIDNKAINESMISKVMTITVTKSKSNLVFNRLFGCKMLSKLSQRFTEELFIEEILPLVQYLCRDSLSCIRAEISAQLLVFSQNLCFQTIKTRILPLIEELLKDKEPVVREACFEALIHSIPRLNEELNRDLILPLIVSVFDDSLFSNSLSLNQIFISFGELCQNMPKSVVLDTKWFLDYYCNVFLISNDFQFVAKNAVFKERDIHCRYLLALYFPILFTIYGQNENLLSILNFLCSDLNPIIIITIASVFKQINAQMGNGFKLYPQLSKLLNQCNIDVYKLLTPFLSELVIDAINATPDENKNDFFDDLTKSLSLCENCIFSALDWRLQIQFLEQLNAIMPSLPTDYVKPFIQLVLKRVVTSRPIPVRIAASSCALSLFRDIPDLSKDFNIYEWFVKTLAFGNSSQRMLFLNVCELINQLCDKQTMISYFLEPLLNLREDKVPNIRRNVCKKFLSFKQLIKSTEISDQIQRFKAMFRQMLSKERDVDVIEAIDQLVDEFEWKSGFEALDMELLAQEFVSLTINGLVDSCESIGAEVNGNSLSVKAVNSDKNHLLRQKSCLPQLIRSECNQSPKQGFPTNQTNSALITIPSKIPKAITKSSK